MEMRVDMQLLRALGRQFLDLAESWLTWCLGVLDSSIGWLEDLSRADPRMEGAVRSLEQARDGVVASCRWIHIRLQEVKREWGEVAGG